MAGSQKKRSRPVGIEGYLVRSIGTLPWNLGIGLVQAMTEAVVDSARLGVELVKMPGRVQKGKNKEALQEPLEVAFGGVVNALKNALQPLYRSHQMGVENPEMMDPGHAVMESLSQLGDRFKLLGESLTPEQKSELVSRVKSKVAEVAPEEADKAARRVRQALGGIGKKEASSRPVPETEA